MINNTQIQSDNTRAQKSQKENDYESENRKRKGKFNEESLASGSGSVLKP
jgi:hypothetical protein